MGKSPFRVIFLGNRRIAWDALNLLSEDPYRRDFDVRVIVTDADIWRNCQARGFPHDAVYISSQQRHSELIRDAIVANSVDLILSIQYNWVIATETIDLVKGRAFNLHNARLPDYKGYNSISHAIANGDTTYDTTVHWMAEKVDCGDIAYVSQTSIASDDTALSLYVKTAMAAKNSVRCLLDDLSRGIEPPRKPQVAGAGTFYPRNSISELANVTGEASPEKLARIARAAYFPPYNTAFILHDKNRYILLPESGAQDLIQPGRPVNQPIF